MTTATTTQTRQISPRAARQEYALAAQAVRKVTAIMEANPAMDAEYRGICRRTWIEQMDRMGRAAQHPAVINMTEADRTALAR